MKLKDYAWPAIGLAAVGISVWLLYKELRSISLDDVIDSINAIDAHRWILAALASLVAYAALAGYDRIALLHLRRHISWLFIALCSFTTYALSHNIGASVLSGAVVRYRAYSSQGMSGPEIALLIAFCSFTFMLGVITLAAFVLLIEPELPQRFNDEWPLWFSYAIGGGASAFVLLYVFGSWLKFKPLRIRQFTLEYPRLSVVMQQLVVGPLELIGAAAIIYFTLPAAGNPGFLIILGIFLVSFSAALISHAPGGLGVLELVFLTGLPDMNKADVLAALIIFRLFYLLIPFALSLIVVLFFERSQLLLRWYRKDEDS
ncbi:lysylphosphatidylglycerol synthase domain-containing protein [Phyllobacterium sp. 21LDTY02-6]|uniref:lysylphosphatidylglycerol synthase domain-containing protein n=1 Tax=unclassified Phyllobacterium TaxID=2638441 RepID=UPI0020220ECD|nr:MULTISPECIES: lysylphosphatidylglycerol synthase domain-containing protein [unclassified Phyllobacterium]MCO4316053.1 lysylphosphatidylglycerol synthase domain-containing protein [Phyllobacterium sp. 21LDTY02-6]MCX8279524.1 lysylphosphatidylglycerol synthase domain-containing protein [Phyllobacterium sp. 0TCS1.6C]MCX8292285.1 lysylphosphatidylglycerol synthase domain-containing protein [Phyllobacterium sp. 0TCS1.6A]